MKIKLVNFLSNSKKLHLKCESNLYAVLKHLKSKYETVQIHSIHPDEGPLIVFKPIAKIKDVENQLCAEEKSKDVCSTLICIFQCMLFAMGLCYWGFKWCM